MFMELDEFEEFKCLRTDKGLGYNCETTQIRRFQDISLTYFSLI